MLADSFYSLLPTFSKRRIEKKAIVKKRLPQCLYFHKQHIIAKPKATTSLGSTILMTHHQWNQEIICQGPFHFHFCIFNLQKFNTSFENMFIEFSKRIPFYETQCFWSHAQYHAWAYEWSKNIFFKMRMNHGSMDLVTCFLQRIEKFPCFLKYRTYLGALYLLTDKIVNDDPLSNRAWATIIQHFDLPKSKLTMYTEDERLELINQSERTMLCLLNFDLFYDLKK